MSDAVFSDGKYTFNSEPRVVKGVHETILWFVTGSDISTGMVPSVLPHQEVGEFVDAFLVYYNSSAQIIVSKEWYDGSMYMARGEVRISTSYSYSQVELYRTRTVTRE
jgi:hypothetical protein